MADAAPPRLTSALEDYLETIYQLVRANKVARVKDIAAARGVRSASVSPAMKRLADLGFIRYEQREYIDLTPEGAKVARRVLSRHLLLTRFLNQFLGISPSQSEEDACAMEHSLSPEGMSHLVKLFEFLDNCPAGRRFLEQFHGCHLVQEGGSDCPESCPYRGESHGYLAGGEQKTLDTLLPGEEGRVIRVEGQGAIRQRILDMGLLPGVKVQLERVAPVGDPLWIRVQGFQLSLRRREAMTIQLTMLTGR